jgi:hypothetical protein
MRLMKISNLFDWLNVTLLLQNAFWNLKTFVVVVKNEIFSFNFVDNILDILKFVGNFKQVFNDKWLMFSMTILLPKNVIKMRIKLCTVIIDSFVFFVKSNICSIRIGFLKLLYFFLISDQFFSLDNENFEDPDLRVCVTTSNRNYTER